MSFPEKKFKAWLSYKESLKVIVLPSEAARWGYEQAQAEFKQMLVEQRKEAKRICVYNNTYGCARLDLIKLLEESGGF